MSTPGSSRPGTNPEQLFATGWPACFIGAIGLAAGQQKVELPADLAVDAQMTCATATAVTFCRHG
ncbi:organic hydroperoxide reductase OsmC/OhrA [Ensifer sp. 4252]